MIELKQVGEIADVLAPLAAVASILIAVRVYRRQMNAQLFVAYTERYEQIMASFPPEARALRRKRRRDLPAQTEALTLAVLRYLNLCSEEFYLHRSGHLSTKLWRIWEDELRRTVSSDLVRREWADLRGEFESYPEFVVFVESAQSQASAGTITVKIGTHKPATLPSSAPVEGTASGGGTASVA
jgi:hypothetical protein